MLSLFTIGTSIRIEAANIAGKNWPIISRIIHSDAKFGIGEFSFFYSLLETNLRLIRFKNTL